jgi:hypothetical protein
VDFSALKSALAAAVQGKQVERRAHPRVRMRVNLKLRGTDGDGKQFEELTTTENVSAGGFFCPSSAALVKGGIVEVFLVSAGNQERYAGRAHVVRREAASPWPRYGFQFEQITSEWVLQSAG